MTFQSEVKSTLEQVFIQEVSVHCQRPENFVCSFIIAIGLHILRCVNWTLNVACEHLFIMFAKVSYLSAMTDWRERKREHIYVYIYIYISLSVSLMLCPLFVTEDTSAGFSAEEQRFYSKLLADDQIPHPIIRGEARQPMKETNLGRWYLQPYSLGYNPVLMTMGESRGGRLTGKFLFAATDWFSVTAYPFPTLFDPNSSILVIHPFLAENHGLTLVKVVKVM